MDRNDLTTKQQRQLKFAEAGVLFVLVMALTVFLGVKLVSNSPDATDNGALLQAAVIPPIPADAAPPVATDSATDIVAAGPEPAGSTAPTEAEAIAVAEPVSTKPDQPREVSYTAAEAAYFAGHWAEAVDLFAAYTDQHAENAWGYYMLGLSQRQDGSPEAAQQSLLTALEIAPDHVKSQVNLARVRLDLGQAVAAVEPLQRVLADEPENVQARRVLGRTYSELGRPDEAIAAYRGALRIDPQDAWSLNNLGLLYIETERFAEAVAPLARACQLDSSVACFENNLGIALERTGHTGAAAVAFAAALAADADYAKAAVSLDRLEVSGAADQPITIDLVAVAAELRFDPDADSFTAAEMLAGSDQQTVADNTRGDDDW